MKVVEGDSTLKPAHTEPGLHEYVPTQSTESKIC